MISRPHLLTAIKSTGYLAPGHGLKRWASGETIREEDEFELDQWPARSLESLLTLAAKSGGDPYFDALRIALMISSRQHVSPFPAGTTVQSVLDRTRRSANRASDPFLEMLIANQASVLVGEVNGAASQELILLGWGLGLRLTDRDPIYIGYFLMDLWQYWNAIPRSYAFSHSTIPAARKLLRHLGDLDRGKYEVQRKLLWLEADLELLIANVRTSDLGASLKRCFDLREQVIEFSELLDADEPAIDPLVRSVQPHELGRICEDLAMTLFFLEQYTTGLELLRAALLLRDIEDAEEMIETLDMAIEDLGLIDSAH